MAGQFGGVLPVGNVHPNAKGYGVIAADIAAATVPEPASWPLLAAGIATVGILGRSRRTVPGAA